MPTTIAVRFELGRYHATRWDGGANTSDVEWPPSPWRILRALLATRHTRWPELPSGDIARLLAALGTPAAYYTPPIRAGTTRHYMPLPPHRTDSTGATAQVIDAFLAVSTDEPLLVQWAVDLPPDDRAALRKLLELVPYLGRSESLARLELRDDAVPVDDTWWRLGVLGPDIDQVQLLAPTTITLPVLEQTTTSVRKARRTLPPGTATVVYGRRRAARPEITPRRPMTRGSRPYGSSSQARYTCAHAALCSPPTPCTDSSARSSPTPDSTRPRPPPPWACCLTAPYCAKPTNTCTSSPSPPAARRTSAAHSHPTHPPTPSCCGRRAVCEPTSPPRSSIARAPYVLRHTSRTNCPAAPFCSPVPAHSTTSTPGCSARRRASGRVGCPTYPCGTGRRTKTTGSTSSTTSTAKQHGTSCRPHGSNRSTRPHPPARSPNSADGAMPNARTGADEGCTCNSPSTNPRGPHRARATQPLRLRDLHAHSAA